MLSPNQELSDTGVLFVPTSLTIQKLKQVLKVADPDFHYTPIYLTSRFCHSSVGLRERGKSQ